MSEKPRPPIPRLGKPALVDHPIHPALAERWSPRAFAPEGLTREDLRSLLEAARWAPSCFNEQPWSFLVATRQEQQAFGRILSTLVPVNRSWAEESAVLILTVARLHLARNDQPNRHALHDVGLAVGGLCVEATARGIGLHQLAGFDADRAREACGIPEGWEPVSVIALGRHGDPEGLPEDLRERELAPRVRVPQEQFVFGGRWGEPPGWDR